MTNPETHDGYTLCCNKTVCRRSYTSTFTNEANETFVGCCAAKALKNYEEKYGHEFFGDFWNE
jgi:hypothetical protein